MSLRMLPVGMIPVLCVFCTLVLSAAKPTGGAFPHTLSPDGFVTVTEDFIQLSIEKYFTVYGTYPETWSAVRAAGICQVDLTRDGDNILTLDDEFGGEWDAKYSFNGPDRPPTVLYNSAYGASTHWLPKSPLTTWDSFAALVEEKTDNLQSDEMIARIKGNRDVQRLLALRSMVAESIHYFMLVHNRPPHSWQELAESGLSVIDSDSVNPVTGTPLEGDGGPNDFIYEDRSVNGETGYYLHILDEEGKLYWTGSYL